MWSLKDKQRKSSSEGITPWANDRTFRSQSSVTVMCVCVDAPLAAPRSGRAGAGWHTADHSLRWTWKKKPRNLLEGCGVIPEPLRHGGWAARCSAKRKPDSGVTTQSGEERREGGDGKKSAMEQKVKRSSDAPVTAVGGGKIQLFAWHLLSLHTMEKKKLNFYLHNESHLINSSLLNQLISCCNKQGRLSSRKGWDYPPIRISVCS